MSTSRVSLARPSFLATHSRDGALSRVSTITLTKTRSNTWSAPGIPAAIGMVARMIGTAPRRPAQEMNICSLTGTRNHDRHAKTLSGLATNVRNRLATTASTTTCHVILDGVAKRPSMTKSPIWETQPIPSANDRVAWRCGSLPLDMTTEHTYTAEKPDTCVWTPSPYAMT